MNKNNIRKLVVSSMLGAITIVLGLTPLGFIPLGIINATTMHIPVIVGAILEGPIVGASIGLIFGVSSLVKAFLAPGPISFVFYNPLVSILPRVLIGVVSYYVYDILNKRSEKSLKAIAYIIYVLAIGFLSYSVYKNLTSPNPVQTKFVNAGISGAFLALSIFMLYYSYKKGYDNFAIMASAFAGSMTNTILVLGGIYVFYAKQYMQTIGKPLVDAQSAIFGVAVTSGIPEAIICILITTAVVKTVLVQRQSQKATKDPA